MPFHHFITNAICAVASWRVDGWRSCCHIELLNDGGFCLVYYIDGNLCLKRQVGLHKPTPKNYRETLRTIGWDISDHMTRQFRPWSWTVRHIGPDCLLDTLVLLLKCPDTLDPPKQCYSVSVPIWFSSGCPVSKCPVTTRDPSL